MSWANIKATGSGTVDYRLCIAGWPHEWTTSDRISHANFADGRLVFPSLQYKGLKISEKGSIREAWTEVQGITFTINPTTPAEETVNGFTRDSEPLGILASPMDAEGTADVATLDTDASLDAGVYHIGTEALRGFGGNSLTRAVWNTVVEAHPVRSFDLLPLRPGVYDWPPTMEGRRAYLFAYGDGDNGYGEGTQIWVGIVARPPRMNGDGVTWSIVCEPITGVFDQQVAASEHIEYRVRGIYHSYMNPMALAYRALYMAPSFPSGFHHDRTKDGTAWDITYLAGFHESPTEFIQAVNARLNELLLLRGSQPPHNMFCELLSATYAEPDASAPQITLKHTLELTAKPDFRSVWIAAHSLLEGSLTAGVSQQIADGKVSALGEEYFYTGFFSDSKSAGIVMDIFGDGSGQFAVESVPSGEQPPFHYPLRPVRAMLGALPSLGTVFEKGTTLATSNNPVVGANAAADVAAWPPDRLYLNRVDGLDVGSILVAQTVGSDKPTMIEILAINTTELWVSAEAKSAIAVYFDDSTRLVPLRTYALNTSLAGFLISVLQHSPEANDGDTPFVLPGDVDAQTLYARYLQPSGIDTYWYHRDYAFCRPLAIKEIIQPELKLQGLMTRLQTDGRVGFVRMPRFSASTIAAGTLTDADILPPAAGLAGSWPTWESQPEGLVNIANIKIGYNPLTDSYDDDTYNYSDRVLDSIALHKSSGRGTVDIEVKSTSSGASQARSYVGQIMLGQAPDTFAGLPTPERVTRWAALYLALLSTEYAMVTVAVSFKFFDYLVGDLLDVTCSYIPNGQGGRGVQARKAIIVGREWNLDPGAREMGRLTLYFPRYVPAGYTPSALVNSQTLAGGNTWQINVTDFIDGVTGKGQWSEGGTGDVTKHFAIGDAVQVIQRNTVTPVIVKGTVTAIVPPGGGNGLITVAFASAWAPGSSGWILMWQPDSASNSPLTARQKTYAFVASSNKKLVSGGYARKYS